MPLYEDMKKGIVISCSSVQLSFLLLFCVLISPLCAHHPQWRTLARLQQGRYHFGTAYIGNSEVVVAGGIVIDTASTSPKQTVTITNSCEIINTTTGRVTESPPMNHARAEFPLLLSKDSDVVVISGVTSNPYNGTLSKNTPSVELFNPTTRTWKVLGSLLIARRQHAALFINDEEILVVAGRTDNFDGTRSAEIFNIHTGTSRRVADYPYPLNNLQLQKSKTGSILAFGGREGGPTSERHKEIYEYKPEYDIWIEVGKLHAGLYGAARINLWDGGLALFGGSASEDMDGPVVHREVWIETNKGLTPFSDMQQGRFDHGNNFAAQLNNNTVIICGGFDDNNNLLSSAEAFDIRIGRSTPLSPMLLPHVYTRVINVPYRRLQDSTVGHSAVLCLSGISFIRHDDRGNFDSIAITPIIEIFEDPDCHEESIASDFQAVALYGAATLSIASTVKDTTLLLTPAQPNLAAALFSRDQLPLADGFRCSFSFIIEDGTDNSVGDGSAPGGDGLAFVLHNSPTPLSFHEAHGRGLGYSGIANSLAVEFDMYKNTNAKDPDGNHIAVQTNGIAANSSRHSLPTTLGSTSDIPAFQSGSRYFSSVVYKNHRLEVYLDTIPLTERSIARLVIHNFHLESYLHLHQGSGYVGFTASTGHAAQKQSLLQWDFAPCRVRWDKEER